MLERLKLKLYDVLVDVEVSDRTDRIVAICLMALIFTNGLAVILETVKQIEERYSRLRRVFRVFRLFKMTRYIESIRTFHNVFRAKKTELIVTAVLIFLLLIFASSAMYAVENEAQPDKFSSIPETLWWGVVTLTTIGYGDVYPITPLGKLIGGVIALLGIGLFALPTGILASGFSEELQKRQKK